MYIPLQTFVRKDLFSAQKHNQLLENAGSLNKFIASEHVLSTGEHNSPKIARTVGTVRVTGGPTYGLSSFNADVSLEEAHNPDAGSLILTFASDRYDIQSGMMVQNASVDGGTVPCITAAIPVDDTHVKMVSKYFDTAWLDQDASFFAAIHGPILPRGSIPNLGHPRQRSNGLRAASYSTEFNGLVQGAHDGSVSTDVGHRSNGKHNIREIPKLWAYVQWNGAGYDIVDSYTNDVLDENFDAFTAVSAGIVEMNYEVAEPFDDANYQVFVSPSYASQDGGSPDDIFIACVPDEELDTTTGNIYLWKRVLTGGVESWDRADCDFHIWLFEQRS